MAKQKKEMKTIYLSKEVVPAFDLLCNKSDFIASALRYFVEKEEAKWIFIDVEKAKDILLNKKEIQQEEQKTEKKILEVDNLQEDMEKNNDKKSKNNSSETSGGFEFVD